MNLIHREYLHDLLYSMSASLYYRRQEQFFLGCDSEFTSEMLGALHLRRIQSEGLYHKLVSEGGVFPEHSKDLWRVIVHEGDLVLTLLEGATAYYEDRFPSPRLTNRVRASVVKYGDNVELDIARDLVSASGKPSLHELSVRLGSWPIPEISGKVNS